MSEFKMINSLVHQLCNCNEEEKEIIRDKIFSMGNASIKSLSRLIYQQKGDCYTEIFKIFSSLGNNQFKENGIDGLDAFIIKTMNSGAKKLRQYASEEVYEISVNSLTLWGLEIPPILKQKVFTCHVCGKNSTKLRVSTCAIHTCNKPVCREHASVISTRFGQFDGSGGAWFCSNGHYSVANKNHLEWN